MTLFEKIESGYIFFSVNSSEAHTQGIQSYIHEEQ